MYARILVPIDGTACSDEACREAVELAKALGSSVQFLFVVDSLVLRREGVANIGEGMSMLRSHGREILDRAVGVANRAGVRCDAELAEGIISETISKRATVFDLVILGTRGEGLLLSIWKDAVVEHVVHHVTSPLLLVHSASEGTRSS